MMAMFSMAPQFSDMDDWIGTLLQSRGDEDFLARTATRFSWRFGSDSEFEGYTVTATGSGFKYLIGDPIAGSMSSLVIRNADGDVVLTVTGLSGFASDLSQFVANVFGGGEQGPGPDGKIAWSHLMAGNDTITGTQGEDRQEFTGTDVGNDTYILRGGEDRATGGVGNDTYFGGDGDDGLSYRETQWNEGMTAFRGVTINVETGVALDPWGGTDKFSSFEYFQGSRFNDTFLGSNTERDEFSGLRGRDVIDGGAKTFDRNGDQTDDDRDRVQYSDDYWGGGRFGIVVDLQTSVVAGSIRGTARDGFGNTDTLIDIERVEGTRFGDSLTGSQVSNMFAGGEGRDTYDGGAGIDMVRFDNSFGDGPEPTGVNVNMARANGQIINDGFGNTETMINIEELLGSDSADILRGNGKDNFIEGQRGADTLAGQGGNDIFYFAQDDMDFADRVLDFDRGGAGVDQLAFGVGDWENMTTTLRLVNGNAATSGAGTFLFVNATDQLIWDENGTGAGGRTLIAVLDGISSLSAANFALWD